MAGSSECGCDVALGTPASDATVDGSMSPPLPVSGSTHGVVALGNPTSVATVDGSMSPPLPVSGNADDAGIVVDGNPTSDATVDGSMSPVTGSDSSDAAGSVVSDATVGISVGSTGGATSAMTLKEGANDRLTAASTGRGAITAAIAAPAHISATSFGDR